MPKHARHLMTCKHIALLCKLIYARKQLFQHRRLLLIILPGFCDIQLCQYIPGICAFPAPIRRIIISGKNIHCTGIACLRQFFKKHSCFVQLISNVQTLRLLQFPLQHRSEHPTPRQFVDKVIHLFCSITMLLPRIKTAKTVTMRSAFHSGIESGSIAAFFLFTLQSLSNTRLAPIIVMVFHIRLSQTI